MPHPNFSIIEKFFNRGDYKMGRKKESRRKVESSRHLCVYASTISDIIRPKVNTKIKYLTIMLLILNLSPFQRFLAWINWLGRRFLSAILMADN
jgi:hypothetical protein